MNVDRGSLCSESTPLQYCLSAFGLVNTSIHLYNVLTYIVDGSDVTVIDASDVRQPRLVWCLKLIVIIDCYTKISHEIRPIRGINSHLGKYDRCCAT